MGNNVKGADSMVVLDFETTGLSPNKGDRAIEIGAVRIVDGKVTDSFQELMNPGFRVSSFIEQYTGISNQVLSKAAPCAEVMQRFHDFMGEDNLLAHNASFDKQFLDAEFARISCTYTGEFACSLLISRRIYQQAPNHQLSTLIRYKDIPSNGGFHRALFDAQMTSQLWLAILADIKRQALLDKVSFLQVKQLAKTSKKDVKKLLQQWSA